MKKYLNLLIFLVLSLAAVFAISIAILITRKPMIEVTLNKEYAVITENRWGKNFYFQGSFNIKNNTKSQFITNIEIIYEGETIYKESYVSLEPSETFEIKQLLNNSTLESYGISNPDDNFFKVQVYQIKDNGTKKYLVNKQITSTIKEVKFLNPEGSEYYTLNNSEFLNLKVTKQPQIKDGKLSFSYKLTNKTESPIENIRLDFELQDEDGSKTALDYRFSKLNSVTVYLLKPKEEISADYMINLNEISEIGTNYLKLNKNQIGKEFKIAFGITDSSTEGNAYYIATNTFKL